MAAHQDQFRGFARYNAGFNRRLYDLAGALTPEERERDMGAFFGSVSATLNHILVADRIWLGRFAPNMPESTALAGADVIREVTSLRQPLADTFDELAAARHATDEVITRWVEELTDDVLAGTMSYHHARDGRREHPVWLAVSHLFNHQTHHRGQVTTLLHQLGHDPGVTDLFVWAVRDPNLV